MLTSFFSPKRGWGLQLSPQGYHLAGLLVQLLQGVAYRIQRGRPAMNEVQEEAAEEIQDAVRQMEEIWWEWREELCTDEAWRTDGDEDEDDD